MRVGDDDKGKAASSAHGVSRYCCRKQRRRTAVVGVHGKEVPGGKVPEHAQHASSLVTRWCAGPTAANRCRGTAGLEEVGDVVVYKEGEPMRVYVVCVAAWAWPRRFVVEVWA